MTCHVQPSPRAGRHTPHHSHVSRTITPASVTRQGSTRRQLHPGHRPSHAPHACPHTHSPATSRRRQSRTLAVSLPHAGRLDPTRLPTRLLVSCPTHSSSWPTRPPACRPSRPLARRPSQCFFRSPADSPHKGRPPTRALPLMRHTPPRPTHGATRPGRPDPTLANPDSLQTRPASTHHCGVLTHAGTGNPHRPSTGARTPQQHAAPRASPSAKSHASPTYASADPLITLAMFNTPQRPWL